MGLEGKFKEQVDSIKALKLDFDIIKDMYSNCRMEHKKDNGHPSKAVLENACQARDEVEM
jgi:hypothetical protein